MTKVRTETPVEPVEVQELALYCGICGQRMVVFKTEVIEEGKTRVKFWKCKRCAGSRGTTTASRLSKYRRH